MLIRTRSPIIAQEVDGEWFFEAFEIEYLDDDGARWLVSLAPMRWL